MIAYPAIFNVVRLISGLNPSPRYGQFAMTAAMLSSGWYHGVNITCRYWYSCCILTSLASFTTCPPSSPCQHLQEIEIPKSPLTRIRRSPENHSVRIQTRLTSAVFDDSSVVFLVLSNIDKVPRRTICICTSVLFHRVSYVIQSPDSPQRL